MSSSLIGSLKALYGQAGAKYRERYPRIKDVLSDLDNTPTSHSIFGYHVKGICETLMRFVPSGVHIKDYNEGVFARVETKTVEEVMMQIHKQGHDIPVCLHSLADDMAKTIANNPNAPELKEQIGKSRSIFHLFMELAKKLNYTVTFAVIAVDTFWCLVHTHTFVSSIEILGTKVDGSKMLVLYPELITTIIGMADNRTSWNKDLRIVPAIVHPLLLTNTSLDMVKVNAALPLTYKALTDLFSKTGTYTLDDSGQNILQHSVEIDFCIHINGRKKCMTKNSKCGNNVVGLRLLELELSHPHASVEAFHG